MGGALQPNLFIVGAPKCGTTAWAQYLGDHPDIFFPEVKEPHYFATDFPPQRRIADYAEYEALFAGAERERVIGEASVGYLYSTRAAKEIHAFDPGANILIFLRNQEDYLRSWHNQLLYNGTEIVKDFRAAWSMSGSRPAETISRYCLQPRILDYKAVGRFAEQIEPFLRLFGSDRVRIYHFDAWSADPRPAYVDILDFLGVPDDGRRDFPPVNEARHHPGSGRMVDVVRSPAFRSAAKLVRRIAGKRVLGWGELALRLSSRKGYAKDRDPQLSQEIRAYFAEDNSRLRPWLRIPPA